MFLPFVNFRYSDPRKRQCNTKQVTFPRLVANVNPVTSGFFSETGALDFFEARLSRLLLQDFRIPCLAFVVVVGVVEIVEVARELILQDVAEYSPFAGIEKGAVLQEARVFNDPQLDPRRCSQVITKLLYLLNQGDTFTKVRPCSFFRKTGNSSPGKFCSKLLGPAAHKIEAR
ncbi:coatomer subunit gamma [Tanacetum coccineum]